MNSWLWAALVAVGGAALWYIMTMNRFARLLVKIRESDSGIEVALTRRFDTLTRMLDVTRAYARHEAGTLGSIVKMRQGMSMAQWSDATVRWMSCTGKSTCWLKRIRNCVPVRIFAYCRHPLQRSKKNCRPYAAFTT